jgi:hypothetical protein
LVIALFVFGFSCEDIISPVVPGRYPTAFRAIIVIVLDVMAGAASVTGLISIIKRKQGAILVFVSTALGLFLLIELIIGGVL